MSASIRPTWWPRARRPRARLAATVDLPTPPLPLATAITCRMPGSVSFCCVPAPWECMGESPGVFVLIFERLAQFAQVFERVDAGVVGVAPGDLVGVIADRRHPHWSRPPRSQFLVR